MNLKEINTIDGKYVPVRAHFRKKCKTSLSYNEEKVTRDIEYLELEKEQLKFRLNKSPYPYPQKDKEYFRERLQKINYEIEELKAWHKEIFKEISKEIKNNLNIFKEISNPQFLKEKFGQRQAQALIELSERYNI
jgi:hypothetical protein